MAPEVLPLFPLDLVLFPGAALPLHIFEERYKALIGHCLATGTEFGINMVSGGTIETVGCTAAVTRVVRRYPDGRMDIEVEGRRRYRLEASGTGATPYLTGKVRYFEDTEAEVDDALARETVGLYNTMVRTAWAGRVEEEEHHEGRKVAFHLARKAGLTAAQRQSLLELTSENARLTVLRNHLEDLIPRLARMEEIERLVRNDGFL